MRRTDGFTLMELMVTVAIVAVLASLAVAGYSRLIEGSRLTTAANNIKGDLELARVTAVKRHVTVLAYFDDGAGNTDFYGNIRDLQVFKRAMSDGELYLLTVTQYQSYQEMATALNYTL